MAGGMPLRSISKGPLFRLSDTLLADATKRVYVLLQGLKGVSFAEILQSGGFMNSNEYERFSGNWLTDEPPGWWPNYPDKVDILTEGYRKAIERSLGFNKTSGSEVTVKDVQDKIVEINGNENYGKPVVSYWLCAGHHFQCAVCEADKQVTLLILTPPTPQNVVPDKPSTQFQDVWLVSNQQAADALRTAATYGAGGTSPESEERIPGTFVTPIYGEEDGAFTNG